MKRNPRKLGWTKAYRKAHGKESTENPQAQQQRSTTPTNTHATVVVDSTLAFAARRNVPVRYNRDLVAKTLQAMQRVEEIRTKRERAFYKERMRGNKARELERDRKLVAENQHLLPPEERDEVPEHVRAKLEQMDVEREQDVDEVDMDEQEEELPKMKVKVPKAKRKQRLVVGKGVEDMDVDG